MDDRDAERSSYRLSVSSGPETTLIPRTSPFERFIERKLKVSSEMGSARLAVMGANLLLVGIVALPILLYHLIGVPFKRGFYCHDASLSYPYHHSTIGMGVLYAVGFVVPPLTIIIVEFLFTVHPHPEKKLRVGPLTLSPAVVSSTNYILAYLFGAAASQCLTDISKYTVGRLRPHFFDVCQPDFASIACGTHEQPHYVVNYTCQGNPLLFPDPAELESRLKDVHLSFVSGHSSFSFQTSIFVILYLQARIMRRDRSSASLLLAFVQFIVLVYAFFTSLSRVSDYKHHPGDVLAGAILGTVVQIINVKYISKLFVRETQTHEELPLKISSMGPSYNSNGP